MLIRKLFKFEAAHIVRNCSTVRCRENIHGHSFRVEVFLQSNRLDRAGMVLDFSLLKPQIGKFIDAFDHTYIYWSEEPEDFKNKIKSLSNRWIELPFSPTAENLALMFHFWIQRILDNSEFSNCEGEIKVHCVRVHETETGFAQTEPEEQLVQNMTQYPLYDYDYSESIAEEGFSETIDAIVEERPFKFAK
jgi:6-pyruvoyltetrahydropterin/6-carboxytetrahydropterin synthase